MIISLMQEKGGAGKTTIAINIAAAIKEMGHSVLLVDADQQGSARDWHTNNDGTVLDVLGLDRPTIDKDIQKYARQYDYVFIDGAPRLSSVSAKIIVCSDIILIPVQPSPYDVWASQTLVELVKQRQEITGGKTKAAFIISRRITQTNIGNEVREVLSGYGLPILNYGTYQRVAYPESASLGKTVLEDNLRFAIAKEEIRLLANEIKGFIHDKT